VFNVRGLHVALPKCPDMIHKGQADADPECLYR
jgi:hypothetical protein